MIYISVYTAGHSQKVLHPFLVSSAVNLVDFCALNLLTSEFCYTSYIEPCLERAAIPNQITFASVAISVDILLPIFLIARQPIFHFDKVVLLHTGTCSFSTVSVYGSKRITHC